LLYTARSNCAIPLVCSKYKFVLLTRELLELSRTSDYILLSNISIPILPVLLGSDAIGVVVVYTRVSPRK
jgi:hypothetical protein